MSYLKKHIETQKKKRPKPINKRVWASLEHSFKMVVKEMFEEANNRDPLKKKSGLH